MIVHEWVGLTASPGKIYAQIISSEAVAATAQINKISECMQDAFGQGARLILRYFKDGFNGALSRKWRVWSEGGLCPQRKPAWRTLPRTWRRRAWRS